MRGGGLPRTDVCVCVCVVCGHLDPTLALCSCMCFLNVFACHLTLNCRLLHPPAPQSTGFGLIYDNIEAAKKFEPKYRLQRVSRRMPNFDRRHVTIYLALVMAEFPPLFMVVWGWRRQFTAHFG